MSNPVGRIVSLWRYPVKSMMGEELHASEVTERGLFGDRAYALVDKSTGKVASAKNPRKWGWLFDCRAGFSESPHATGKLPVVRIVLPDGALVTSEESNLGQVLSALFGREVEFAATAPATPSLEEYWPDVEGLAHKETVTDEFIASGAPRGTFFDFAAVHLLTTATLDRLREVYPQGRFEPRRFRPNIVVEVTSGEKGFVENTWRDRTLAIGDEVRLRIIVPCPRCVMTTLPQGDLPNDPGILRTAARHTERVKFQDQEFAALVGVYASVVKGGTIRRGDAVGVE